MKGIKDTEFILKKINKLLRNDSKPEDIIINKIISELIRLAEIVNIIL